MRSVLERVILRLLRNLGFEAAEVKAVEILLSIFEDRLLSILSTTAQRTLLSGKPSTSLLDVLGPNEEVQYLSRRTGKTADILSGAGPQSRYRWARELFRLVYFKPEAFDNESMEEEEVWNSPLSTRVEKFIHIYDFMPNFPPIHTFRLTTAKQQGTRNQSAKVKSRLEQSLRSEGNMIKLIKSSGSLPSFTNFVYKKKK